MTVIVLRENGHLFASPLARSLVAVDTAGKLPPSFRRPAIQSSVKPSGGTRRRRRRR